jgi:hypothetical protein
MMFTSTHNGLPICNQWQVQNYIQKNARAPKVLPKVVATVICMACIAVASALYIMSLGLTHILWRIGMH